MPSIIDSVATGSSVPSINISTDTTLLLVFISAYGATSDDFISSVSCGSVSMTKLGAVNSDVASTSARGIQVWGLLSPPSGTQTISPTISSGVYSSCIIVIVKDVRTSELPQTATAYGASTTLYGAYSFPSGMVLSGLFVRANSASTSQSDLVLVDSYVSSNTPSYLYSQEPPSGSVTYSIPVSDNWAMVNVNLRSESMAVDVFSPASVSFLLSGGNSPISSVLASGKAFSDIHSMYMKNGGVIETSRFHRTPRSVAGFLDRVQMPMMNELGVAYSTLGVKTLKPNMNPGSGGGGGGGGGFDAEDGQAWPRGIKGPS